jgi:hypothetical protein
MNCTARGRPRADDVAIRRVVLARIGGFASIANQLADDYRLGELTRRIGLRIVLSPGYGNQGR